MRFRYLFRVEEIPARYRRAIDDIEASVEVEYTEEQHAKLQEFRWKSKYPNNFRYWFEFPEALRCGAKILWKNQYYFGG